MKFHAFISYSHRDKVWGDWLHKALEAYQVPRGLVGLETSRGEPVPARVYPVFRDREELPTAVDLGSVITQALEQSRYLIVICSPNSARSEWVNQEILNYKKLGRENRVLAIIVDGEPNAAEGKPGFLPEQECFPRALKFKVGADGLLTTERTEPIAADARAHADGKPNALLKLLAGVLGVNYDDLKRRDEEARRRRQRIIVATTSALCLLFAGLSALSVWQWRVAVERRQLAETRLYQNSLALAYGSLRDGRAEQARKALWQAPQALRNWEWGYLIKQVYPSLASFQLLDTEELVATWISSDGQRRAAQFKSSLVCVRWVSGKGFVQTKLPLPELARVDVSADGRQVLLCAEGKVSLWDADAGTFLKELSFPAGSDWATARFWDRAATAVFVSHEDRRALHHLSSGKVLWTHSGELGVMELLAVAKGERAIAYNTLDGTGGLLGDDGKCLVPVEGNLVGANFAAFTEDSRAAVLMTGAGAVWDIDLSVDKPVWRQIQASQADLSSSNRTASGAAFSPDGQKLWFFSRERLYTFDRLTQELSQVALPSGFLPSSLAVGVEQVAVGTSRGLVVYFSAEGEALEAQGLAHEGAVAQVSLLKTTSERWVSLGHDGTVQVWGKPASSQEKELSELPGFPAESDAYTSVRTQILLKNVKLVGKAKAAHKEDSISVALNAAGDRLLSGGRDGEVRVWSIPDQELLLTIKAPLARVENLRFSEDPTLLGISSVMYGFSFARSSLWRAENWSRHEWMPVAGSPEEEASAYLEWQRKRREKGEDSSE